VHRIEMGSGKSKVASQPEEKLPSFQRELTLSQKAGARLVRKGKDDIDEMVAKVAMTTLNFMHNLDCFFAHRRGIEVV
jgi:hypothetical protein